MRNRKVAILGTRYQNFDIEASILDSLGVEIVFGSGKDHDAIVRESQGAEIILAGAAPKFDRETLATLTCRGIVRYGVGTESIDLAAAKDLGIWVSRVADYGTEAVATHAVALALSASRKIREADAIVRSGSWGFADLRPLHLPSAMTVGVVGTGRIGRHAAQQFVGLGFKVLTYDIIPPAQSIAGTTFVPSMHDLIEQSNIISLHVPGAQDGTPLIGKFELGLFQLDSILVNTSRGSLINKLELIEALAANRLGMAALDVFEKEPINFAEYEAVADKILFSPHMAWYTEESEADLRTKAAQEAFRLLSGEKPREIVVEPTSEKARA
ncbi:MAG TPA: C-terminal binding protein [Candidatus Nanopelagicaceae bacterium]|nr:C-terminal binding protein [Candidatus Nanopelagicaceae bacterium]